jgi:hypothetical protein
MDAAAKSKSEGWSCPALGIEISRKVCASTRVSDIPCSADCPHNPFGFAGSSQLHEIESRWFDDALRQAKSIGVSLRPDRFRSSASGIFQELAEVEFVMTTLLGNGPIAAESPFSRWAADPSAALTNDERLVTRFRANSRATVVEIQRRQENGTCIAIDVFQPKNGEFVIVHPLLCRSLRYSRHFGWFSWFPHFVHPLGHMVELVPHLWFPWKEEVFHELKSRQNIDYSMTEQRFLRENFCQAVELVGALAQQWDQETETENAGNHYSAVYGVDPPLSQVIRAFESHRSCAPFMVLPRHPTYGPCEGEYRFQIHGNSKELEAYEPYLGSENDKANERTVGMFSLYREVLLFHCSCRPAFVLGRKLLDEDFAHLLRFKYEDILDVTANLRQAPTLVLEPLPIAPQLKPSRHNSPETKGTSSAMNPQVLEDLQVVQQLVREHHDRTFGNFLDRPHVLLEEKTPREASRSTEDRERLVHFIKIAIYELDMRNRQFQLDLNINAIVQELSLHELI